MNSGSNGLDLCPHFMLVHRVLLHLAFEVPMFVLPTVGQILWPYKEKGLIMNPVVPEVSFCLLTFIFWGGK